MSDKINIRQSLHVLIGMLRRNETINAYDLLIKMSKQEDDKVYNRTTVPVLHGGIADGQLWVDTSGEHPITRRYNASTNKWE